MSRGNITKAAPGDGGPLRLRREQLPAADEQVEESRTPDAPRRVRMSTPWGRPVSGAPTVADFVSVGLSEDAARAALRRLVSGSALSFEEACLSASMWTSDRRPLDEARMRRLAEGFAAKGPTP